MKDSCVKFLETEDGFFVVVVVSTKSSNFTNRTSFPLPSLPERVTWKVWERVCPHSFCLNLQLFWSALTRKL